MDAALKAIAEYGVTVVSLVAIALFVLVVLRAALAWLKDQIRDLRATRDRAHAIAEGMVAANEKLARAISRGNELDADFIREIRHLADELAQLKGRVDGALERPTRRRT